MKPIHTDIWSLRFLVKGNRICFIVRTPEGKEKRHWADLPPRTLAAIMEEINEHLEYEAELESMSPEELAERFKETMGS